MAGAPRMLDKSHHSRQLMKSGKETATHKQGPRSNTMKMVKKQVTAKKQP